MTADKLLWVRGRFVHNIVDDEHYRETVLEAFDALARVFIILADTAYGENISRFALHVAVADDGPKPPKRAA